ncbi:MAG: hypothetical protein ACYCX2_02705 [Christensenellales bacterium]
MKKELQKANTENPTNDKGEMILAESVLNKRVFLIGLLLAIGCMVVSILFLTGSRPNPTDTLDWIILATAVVVMFLCIREILLNRKRSIILTPTRMYGNTGITPFDLPYSQIEATEVKSRNNFLYGTIQYLQIKTADGKEYKIEQVKNLHAIARVLDTKLEKKPDDRFDS